MIPASEESGRTRLPLIRRAGNSGAACFLTDVARIAAPFVRAEVAPRSQTRARLPITADVGVEQNHPSLLGVLHEEVLTVGMKEQRAHLIQPKVAGTVH